MLTMLLFLLAIGLLGWQWFLVGLFAITLFQLYPIQSTLIAMLVIALFVLGKKLRKKLTHYLKRYIE